MPRLPGSARGRASVPAGTPTQPVPSATLDVVAVLSAHERRMLPRPGATAAGRRTGHALSAGRSQDFLWQVVVSAEGRS